MKFDSGMHRDLVTHSTVRFDGGGVEIPVVPILAYLESLTRFSLSYPLSRLDRSANLFSDDCWRRISAKQTLQFVTGKNQREWRRGWDSNPRYGFPHARFRGEYFQPLSHLSAVRNFILAERSPLGLCCVAHKLPRITSGFRGDSAAGCKEGLEQGTGFFGEDAWGDFDLMVELGAGEEFEGGAEGAAFWIVSAID